LAPSKQLAATLAPEEAPAVGLVEEQKGTRKPGQSRVVPPLAGGLCSAFTLRDRMSMIDHSETPFEFTIHSRGAFLGERNRFGVE
jgi:hypothetical protein